MFQSAPAIAGGRCTAISCYWMICHQFQSAPAIAGGRCAVSVRVFRGWRLVSIRARHCWRAMRCRGRGGRPSKFVSIRARHCWRAMRSIASSPDGSIYVSIRARHCWRAMRSRSSPHASRKHCFNPRPPLLAGDAHHKFNGFHSYRVFQSAPAIAGGRCDEMQNATPSQLSFNPRPPLLAGDANRDLGEVLQTTVSIRARHCWRAMRCWSYCWSTDKMFQSAPAIAGGRCNTKRFHLG